MEVQSRRKVGVCLGNVPLYRISLVNNKPVNWLKIAQSYFTKEQKKKAKLDYKLNQLN